MQITISLCVTSQDLSTTITITMVFGKRKLICKTLTQQIHFLKILKVIIKWVLIKNIVLNSITRVFFKFQVFSVGWDVKCCLVSTIRTPWHAKDRFIGYRWRKGSWKPSGKHWSLLTNSRRRYIAEILPIRRKTVISINQSINNQSFIALEIMRMYVRIYWWSWCTSVT